jgi:hypothetical protein
MVTWMLHDWVVRIIRDLQHVSVFVVVLNAEQPRIGSVLENLLRLMEECFGKRFWRPWAMGNWRQMRRSHCKKDQLVLKH